MRTFTKLLSTAALALSLAAAGAGHAATVTIGNATMNGTKNNVQWIQTKTGTGINTRYGGKLITGLGSVAVAVNDKFTYNFSPADLVTAGADLTPGTLDDGLLAKLFINATASTAGLGNPASGTPGSVDQAQAGISGVMSLLLTAAHPGGCLSGTCKNLLTANFTNAWILGGGATAHFTGFNRAASGSDPGSTLVLTSDFIDFTNWSDLAFDYTLNTIHAGAGTANSTVTHVLGRSLTSFNAASSGNYSGDAPAIPEPASWALMILGFGGVGVMLRNRRRLAFA